MRKRSVVGVSVLGVLAIAGIIFYFGFSDEAPASNGPDLGRGISSVASSSQEEVRVLNSLRNMSLEERAKAVKDGFPHFERRLATFLRDDRYAQHVGTFDHISRVEYVYGSADGAQGMDRQGRLHHGYISEELVARVYLDDRTEPVDVIVRCTNGIFALRGFEGESLYTAGAPVTTFTIQRGEGLCHHVDYVTAIRIAEEFVLPIHRKKLGKRRYSVITADEAYSLERQTDRFQVRVMVRPGDHFDINAMTLNGRGRAGETG